MVDDDLQTGFIFCGAVVIAQRNIRVSRNTYHVTFLLMRLHGAAETILNLNCFCDYRAKSDSIDNSKIIMNFECGGNFVMPVYSGVTVTCIPIARQRFGKHIPA
jgi:hypothetical protein